MSTRWLSEDEQQVWRAFLEATHHVLEEIDRDLQQDAGIPHAYYEILVRLSEAPGRALRMSELAAATWSSRSRLSHAVSRLEALGWVRRAPCESDKRGLLAELTDEGMQALVNAAPGHVETVRAVLIDRLSAEQLHQLRDLCATVLAPAGPSGRPAASGTRLGG